MKKSLSLLLLALVAVTASAQTPYCCITKGAVLEYANYNDEDKIDSYTRQIVQEVSEMGDGNYDLRIANSTIDKPGQKKDGEEGYITLFNVTNANAQMPVMFGQGTIIEGADANRLPAQIAVGYQLPIGDVRVDMGGMSTVATITENEVAGRGEITVPAGTFKCYIVKQTVTMSTMGMSASTTTKAWYSRGVGLVKSETTMGNRLVARQELVTLKK